MSKDSHPEPENKPASPVEPEPKIIVDSDWKEQVAREKEAAAKSPAAEAAEAAEEKSGGSADDLVAKPAPAADEAPATPPPATFEILVSMLFTQAMSLLGQIPDPSGGPPNVNKPFAKHTIDTLDMLTEKTKGNLSQEEAQMLSEALHALRMAYVNTK